MRMLRKAFFSFLFLFLGNIQAADFKFDNKLFGYYGSASPLTSLLEKFGSNYKVPVIISPNVQDLVNGEIPALPPKDFLNKIAVRYGLIWYFDGSMLYVYKANESKTELLTLSLLTPYNLEKALKESEVWDSRFRWQTAEDERIVYVSGPPRYVYLVQQLAVFLERQLAEQEHDKLFIDIIPLKYASAVDRNVQYRNQTITIPGVATILQDILSEYGSLGKNDSIAIKDAQTGKMVQSQGMSASARIKAEPRLNAIVIRDRIDRFPLYRQLVKTLDVRHRRIELALYIIDINANKLEQIGVDWRAGFKVGGKGFVDVLSTGSASGEEGLTLGNGNTLGTVLGPGASNFFLAKLKLLASSGNAQVVSRPTLLTRENVEAILDNNTTFHVRLQGENSVDLKEIVYGTLMRILPRIIENKNKKLMINLGLRIEDGNTIEGSSVDEIPMVRNTVIDTEASVALGQSLLIGGIYVDRLTEATSAVPFLSELPFFGSLFKSNMNRITKDVRLFLIEPRIIEEKEVETALRTEQHKKYNPEGDVQAILKKINLQPITKKLQAKKTSRKKGITVSSKKETKKKVYKNKKNTSNNPQKKERVKREASGKSIQKKIEPKPTQVRTIPIEFRSQDTPKPEEALTPEKRQIEKPGKSKAKALTKESLNKTASKPADTKIIPKGLQSQEMPKPEEALTPEKRQIEKPGKSKAKALTKESLNKTASKPADIKTREQATPSLPKKELITYLPANSDWLRDERCDSLLVAQMVIEQLAIAHQSAGLEKCKKMDDTQGWKVKRIFTNKMVQ